jgi:hypothetical protein
VKKYLISLLRRLRHLFSKKETRRVVVFVVVREEEEEYEEDFSVKERRNHER